MIFMAIYQRVCMVLRGEKCPEIFQFLVREKVFPCAQACNYCLFLILFIFNCIFLQL